MDADVRDQRDGEISSGHRRYHRASDDADYMPAAAAGVGAAAVVGDSDSAGSYRHVQQHTSHHAQDHSLPAHLRMQQQAHGVDLNRHLLDLHHASSFASSLGNPNAQNLAAVMAAAAAANAAAAATETTGTSKEDVSEEERVRRRREINRNSQKRIRERRNKEMDGLKIEAQRLAADNDSLLRQVEGLTLEKADMLRQIQDLTEKWQQSIAENAWLNRENIQLRNSLQQLNSLVAGAAAGAPAPAPPPSATSALTAAGSGPISAAIAAAAAAAAGARGSGSGDRQTAESMGHLGMGVSGLNLPPLHGVSSNNN